jgi:hypothetical protein
MATKTITRKDAEKVLAAILEQHAWAKEPGFDQPIIVEDWAWDGGPAPFAIVWEGGAFEWTYLFPYGGIDAEFGTKTKDVSSKIPADIYVEPITSWALGIYPG